MPTKHNKTAVGYSLGVFSEHCGRLGRSDADYCTHFQYRPGDRLYGDCELVTGDIEHHMWCNQYRKIK